MNDEDNLKKQEKETDETPNQIANKTFINALQDQAGCAVIPGQTAIELYKQFKKKEYLARSKYKGDFEMSTDLKIGVQVYTKTKEESLPSLKKFSRNVREDPQEGAGAVKLERTYTEVDDPEQKPVNESDQTKAFYYGKQLVPVSSENEQLLKKKTAAKKEEKSENSS